MKLWIRSQDKKLLIKSELLNVESSSEGWCISEYRYDLCLGHYKTEKRALAVLDEIQNILLLKDMYKYDRELVLKGWENVDVKQVQTVRQLMSVYEMPEN